MNDGEPGHSRDDPGSATKSAVRDLVPRTSRRRALAALGALGVGVAGGSCLLAPATTDDGADADPVDLVPDGAATHRAVRSGRWADPTIWDQGDVPTDGARVRIRPDVAVVLDHQAPASHETVRVDGTLAFDPTVDTHLRAGTLVTTEDSTVQVGTADDPVRPDVTARLTFVDGGSIDEDRDPSRQGRGLLALGDVAVHGAETTPWSPLAIHPVAGDEELVLPSAPTNWQPGDDVVVPGVEPTENHDEERTVTAVAGRHIQLDRPLAYDHVPPAADLDAYVVHLSRNVVFESESHEIPRRGHVMVMAPGSRFKYLEAVGLGRTDKSRAFTDPPGGRGTAAQTSPPNPRARYAIHLHRTGPTEARHVVEGCAVRGSPGWGIVNHDSHVDVRDCVTYRVFGAGIVAEQGTEVGRIAGNFALRSAGSGELVDSRELLDHARTGRVNPPPDNVDDFGHGGHGFWMQSPAVELEDNVAAGHRHHGFVYWTRSLVEDPEPDAEATLQSRSDAIPDFPVELTTEAERRVARVEDGLAHSSDFPIRLFRSNTCFASGGGIDVSRQQFRRSHFRYDEWGTIEDFTVYAVGPLETADGDLVGPTGGATSGGNVAVDARLCANLAIRNCRFLGTGSGTAVWRSFPYTDSLLVEDCDIANWDVGVVPAPFNGNHVENIVRNNAFDNDVDVEIPGRFSGDVTIDGNEFADGATAGVFLRPIRAENASPRRIATTDTGIEFDGRTVYRDVSAPDAVFVPDETFASRLKNSDRWAADRFLGEDPSALVGLTTGEVYEEYGIAIRGGIAPADARAHPDVRGGTVGPRSATKTQPTDEVWVDCTAVDGTTGGDFEPVADDLAARDSALALTQPDRHRDEPPRRDDQMATYTVEVDRAGTYYLAARLGATVHDGPWNDSIWMRIDDDTWHTWENLGDRYTWHHYRLSGHESATKRPGRELQFDPGTHTIDVGARGVRVLLDTFLVRHATTGAVAIAEGRPPTT